ncbi:MAG: UDP-N-acetylmuramoyl-tripeptide--D-alanyl-D-alanine ligase [Bdellovibrionota bacterium]|nr:MAG: UDP-N-acetylmuramoyl-tripeptide--D-alanyl-D-alanine ligase [Pseudomonadota bacterium]
MHSFASFMSQSGWDAGDDHRSFKNPETFPGLIETDSRKVKAGQWFVPIVGENHDGHAFIESALSAGAAGFLYARSHAKDLSEASRKKGIAVEDTYKAVQDLARWWRAQHKTCQVIGITGSSGKTSVKELCAETLASLAPTLKTVGSLNNELGVPLTLLKLTSDHRYAVIEMGARHKGDIAFLSDIVKQDVGVLINVGTAHVGEFGSPEKILEAKMEIAVAPSTVYFRDDVRIHEAMVKVHKKSFSFGRSPFADVQVIDDSCDSEGRLSLSLKIKGAEKKLVLPYFHEVYGLNVASVLSIALSLGLAPEDCFEGLKAYNGIKGRFQVHRLGGFTLIDDAYNANPQSMRAGLETVRKAFPDKKKVIVLGDMRELGDQTEAAHRDIGTYCAEILKPDELITVGESSLHLSNAALAAGFSKAKIHHFSRVEDVLPKLDELSKRGDLLYVKASNSLKLSKIVDQLLASIRQGSH